MNIELLDVAQKHLTDRKLAVDGGAFVGKWTINLAKVFDRVIAFEPQSAYAEKLRLLQMPNVEVFNSALMDRSGRGRFIVPPRSSGKPATDKSTTVIRDNAGEVVIVRLDDIALKSCGLIKLNVEGCEALALEGARRTIKRFRPVVIMEEASDKKLPDPYKGAPNRAIAILKASGYRLVTRTGNDSLWKAD